MADTPTLRARFVGGVQWAVTASYVFLLGLVVTAWWLARTGTVSSFDATPAFGAAVAAAFVAGFLWVGRGSGGADAHARRIEAVLALLVFGFLFPFGVPQVFDLLGAPRPVPLFDFGVAYALALGVSYALVYGLGARPFLGSQQ